MKKVFRSITWLFLLVIVVQTISAQVVVGQQSEMQLEYSALPEKIQDLDVHFVADLSYDDHERAQFDLILPKSCLLYTSPSPRDATLSRMPSSA